MNAIDREVACLVEKMTLDEKMLLMHGDKENLKYDGSIALPRLGIPAYVIAHGPPSRKVGWGARQPGCFARPGGRLTSAEEQS